MRTRTSQEAPYVGAKRNID